VWTNKNYIYKTHKNKDTFSGKGKVCDDFETAGIGDLRKLHCEKFYYYDPS
jgi:hypothetical protein